MPDKKIIVIGAVNVDICGTSDKQLILYDSNPGTASATYGGVGRNIAENLCRLGYHVDMITVLGDDTFTEQLVQASEAVGIGFEHSMRIKGGVCSKYISINNANGDMIMAVSDMAIYDQMSVEFISSQMDFINSADMVMLDTNIPEPVLTYVAENCKVPMAVDTVSTTKALKIRNTIDRFSLIKPNMYECEALSGIKIEDDVTLKKGAQYFTDKGVRYTFISLAEEGVYYTDGTNEGTLPICSAYPVVNVSGCGDAFFSAAIDAYLKGYDIRKMGAAGECAAAICAKGMGTISEELTAEHLEQLMEEYCKGGNFYEA